LHRIEDVRGVTGAVTQAGHKRVQDGIATVGGIQWCTGIGCGIQWHFMECGGTWWYALTHDVVQWAIGAFPLGRLMDRDSRCVPLDATHLGS